MSRNYHVHLTYFNLHGKYYSEALLNLSIANFPELCNIWREVQKRHREGNLPGLISGAKNFIVLVNTDHENEHPIILFPGDSYE